MRFLARLFISLLVVLVCIGSIGSISSVYAQSNPYLNPNTNPDVPQNLNTWTQNIMINVMASGICQLAGVNPLDEEQRCLGFDSTTGKIGFIPSPSADGSGQAGGAIGVAGNLIAATFTYPPVTTAEYLSYMGNKFGIVEPAFAQGGTGLRGLTPLIKIWEAFRNIAYLAFVIVFVGIGLMIMLRVKIDPRTVMTIQNSIPKIIIGLVLVTFSLPLAGLLIDLMYVVIFLFFGLFNGMSISPDFTNALTAIQQNQNYQKESVIGAFNAIFAPTAQTPVVGGNVPIIGGGAGIFNVARDVAGAVKDSITVSLGGEPKPTEPIGTAIGSVVGGAAGFAFGGVITAIIGGVLGALVGTFTIASGGPPQGIGAAASLIAFFVIFIAVIFALFRLLMQLVQAYFWILLDIIFAPFWVLGGLFPGSPVSFSDWLRDITAHLSAFPVTIFMFLLGKAFIEGFGTAAAGGGAFYPPLIGAQSVDAIKGFIALGVILLTPQIVTMVKDAFKAPKFPYGAAIGQAIGVSTAVGGAAATTAYSPYGFLAQFRTGPLGNMLGIAPKAPLSQAARTTVEGGHLRGEGR